MTDPYKVLGISPDATDDQVKAAYREMARKYHPDNYADNPLSDLAKEKMQEINEAYDSIVRQRKSGGGYGGSRGSGRYADIRSLISQNRIQDAETLLDGIPSVSRDAEWFFLKGSVLYKKGWLEDAYQNFAAACRMDPSNPEYRAALDRMNAGRQTGSYTARSADGSGGDACGGCSGCDICSGLLCADCCCECMGGDLISCC